MRFLGWGILALAMLEVLSIVLMADWLGGGVTLLLLVAGFVSGLLMMRNLGFSALLMAGESVRSRQQLSLYQLLWPIRFVVAALLLMSPGFASDLVALALMLPLKGKPLDNSDIGAGAHQAQRRRNDADVIEGEYTVSDEAPPPQDKLPAQNRQN